MKLTEITNEPSTGYEAIIRRLIRVDDRDVSLKGLFDHVRNYAICGGVLAAAVYLGKAGSLLDLVSAAILVLMFFTLLLLNIAQGLVLASALGIRRWAGIALGVVMILVFAQLAVTAGLSLPQWGLTIQADAASRRGLI